MISYSESTIVLGMPQECQCTVLFAPPKLADLTTLKAAKRDRDPRLIGVEGRFIAALAQPRLDRRHRGYNRLCQACRRAAQGALGAIQ